VRSFIPVAHTGCVVFAARVLIFDAEKRREEEDEETTRAIHTGKNSNAQKCLRSTCWNYWICRALTAIPPVCRTTKAQVQAVSY